MKQGTRKKYDCKRCNNQWFPYKTPPNICPKCKSKKYSEFKSDNKMGTLSHFLSNNMKAPLIFSIYLIKLKEEDLTQLTISKELKIDQPTISLLLNKLRSFHLIQNTNSDIDTLFDYYIDYVKNKKKKKIKRKKSKLKLIKSLNYQFDMIEKEYDIKKQFKVQKTELSKRFLSKRLSDYLKNMMVAFIRAYLINYFNDKKLLTFHQLFDKFNIWYCKSFENIMMAHKLSEPRIYYYYLKRIYYDFFDDLHLDPDFFINSPSSF